MLSEAMTSPWRVSIMAKPLLKIKQNWRFGERLGSVA
jgi:hypothetical protein